MDTATLKKLGLNDAQAKAYITLIKKGSATPPEVAKTIGGTRTNAYSVLDKLVELGLAKKFDQAKKLHYRPEHPVALEKLVKQQRDDALQREQLVKSSMPTLLSFFYTFSEQPGVRFYQGLAGLDEIYKDTLRTRQDIYLLRSPHETKHMGEKYMAKYIEQRVKLGINTYALTPDLPSANHDKAVDKANQFIRTWLPKNAYDAPVEIDIYGDKVALISFGEEAIGTIIESPQIAGAMKQLFTLIQVAVGPSAPDPRA